MQTERQLELGTKPVGRLILQYSLPSIIAMTAQSLYNMVDRIMIGHGCGAMAIAGLAVTFPLMNLSGAFGAMVGVGAGTVTSVKLGQKDNEAAELILGNVVILNTIIGILFSVICLTFLDPILMFFGASEQTLPYAKDYMRVLLFGNVLTHLYLGLNDVVRASGYPQKAMAATILAVVVNCVFNALFIFVLDMGIQGAALGTLCAQASAFVFVVRHLTRSDTFLRFKRGIFKLKKRIVKDILSIGLSPFLTNCCACLVVSVINQGLVKYGGDYHVGAYGIDNSIAFIFVMICQGLNQGMQPILGYNYGAGQIERGIKAYKITATLAAGVMMICFCISMFCPEAPVRLFTTDQKMVDIAADALRIMTVFFPLVGFQIVSTGFFMSLGMAQKAIFLSLTRQLIYLIPALLIMPKYFGVDGIWYAMPVSDALSIITVIIMISVQMKKFKL